MRRFRSRGALLFALAAGGCSSGTDAWGGHVCVKGGPSVLDAGDSALEGADDALDILQQHLNNVLD